jgi:hypothetical protein
MGGADTINMATPSSAGLMSAVDKTSLNNLVTLVGDTPVSDQIDDVIANLGTITIDIEDADSGAVPYTNADQLGGIDASEYALNNNVAMMDLETFESSGDIVLTNSDLLAGMTYQQIMDNVYPVGRVIMTFETEDPNTSYPWQTWERTANGRFLLGASDNYAVGSEGGEATHTLTADELPSISGGFAFNSSGGTVGIIAGESTSGVFTNGAKVANSGVPTKSSASDNVYRSLNMRFGSDQPHNNMPPYLTVNMWKRTA